MSLTNKLELTDTFQNVTILFADIAGFTKYSSSVRPEDVVNMLSKLFTKFDKECVRHKVYKVYTIGDCYVVLGFINANQRNILEEAKNVVKMGQSMIEIIRVVRQEANFLGLDMRIGIHTVLFKYYDLFLRKLFGFIFRKIINLKLQKENNNILSVNNSI